MHTSVKVTFTFIALSMVGCIATPDDSLGDSNGSSGGGGNTSSGGFTSSGGKVGIGGAGASSSASGGGANTGSSGDAAGGSGAGGEAGTSGGSGSGGNASGGNGSGSGGNPSSGGANSTGGNASGGNGSGGGAGCACDQNSWCEPGCGCDLDCASPCPCDFGGGCNVGCACDPFCYQPAGPTSGACTTLALPASTAGSIDATDPVFNTLPHDTYCVTLNAGNKLSVETSGSGNAISDTVITLTDSAGKLLTYDDDGAPNFFSKFEFVASSSGTYVISVFPVNSYVSGDYALSVSAQ
ncbi:MAG: PPC domain-containing protein [Polyangiaceae bacterium]